MGIRDIAKGIVMKCPNCKLGVVLKETNEYNESTIKCANCTREFTLNASNHLIPVKPKVAVNVLHNSEGNSGERANRTAHKQHSPALDEKCNYT